MLLIIVLWLMRLPFSTKLKQMMIASLLIAGLLGFFWKYSGFFAKGATSVGARFDYWSAAVKNVLAHPVTGTGPGTFSTVYQTLKRPESEMARLAHNDYLQQASDSGLPGFLLYAGSVISLLVLSFPSIPSASVQGPATPSERKGNRNALPTPVDSERHHAPDSENFMWFAIWLGVLGWSLQCLMEFSLYIPALAWPAFAFFGLLLRHRFQPLDTASVSGS